MNSSGRQYVVALMCLLLTRSLASPEESSEEDDEEDLPFKSPFKNKHHLSYDFAYNVRDDDTGAAYSQRETRDGKETKGEYRVALPDGRIQIVSYIADDKGYRAKVSYEPKEPASKTHPKSHSAKSHLHHETSEEEEEEPNPRIHNRKKLKTIKVKKTPVLERPTSPHQAKIKNEPPIKTSPHLPHHYLDSIHATARPPYYQQLPAKAFYYQPENHYLNRHREIYPHSPYGPHNLPPPTHKHKAFKPPHITRPPTAATKKIKATQSSFHKKAPTITTFKPSTATTRLPIIASTPNAALFFEVKKAKPNNDPSPGTPKSIIRFPTDKTDKSSDPFPTIFRSSTFRPSINNTKSNNHKHKEIKTTSQSSLIKFPTTHIPKQNINIHHTKHKITPVPIKPLENTHKLNVAPLIKHKSFITTHSPKPIYSPHPPAFAQTPPPRSSKPSSKIITKPHRRPVSSHEPPKSHSLHPTKIPNKSSKSHSTTRPPHISTSLPKKPKSHNKRPTPISKPTHKVHSPHPTPRHLSRPTLSAHPSYSPRPTPRYPTSPAPYPISRPTYPPYPGPTHSPHHHPPFHPGSIYHPPPIGPTHAGHQVRPPPYPPRNPHYQGAPPYPPNPYQPSQHHSPYAPFPVPFFMPQYGPLFYNPYYHKSYHGPPKHNTTKKPKGEKTTN